MKHKLSICIPTFNRARKLQDTLDSLQFPGVGPVEIVVCDNASTDETRAVVESMMSRLPHLKYYRQRDHHTAATNYASALRLAAGEYSLFLADDDRIDGDHLYEILGFLDAHRDVVACFTGWHCWDHHAGRSLETASIRQLQLFDADQKLELFDFVMRNNWYPEIGVYRTRFANKVRFSLRHTWPFHWWMWNHLRHGKVCFHPTVFYKNTVRFATGEMNRGTEGIRATIECVDQFRAAAESLLFAARMDGCLGTTTRPHDGCFSQIERYVTNRLLAAAKLSAARHDYVSAYEFLSRVLATDPAACRGLQMKRRQIETMAGVQAIVELFQSMPDTDEIVVCGFASSELFFRACQRVQPDLPIRRAELNELLAGPLERLLVVVGEPENIEPFERAGMPSGRVCSLTEACACFHLLPRKVRPKTEPSPPRSYGDVFAPA